MKPWPRLARIHTIAFDFDGVFTDNRVLVDQNGIESVICDRADGLAMDMLRHRISAARLDIELFILSREKNPVVSARARKLRLQCRANRMDKKRQMDAYLGKRFKGKRPYEGVTFLANDLNDLELVRAVGFSVVPGDAHPLVKRGASAVLRESGGNGFVRAFVEKLLRIEKMGLESIYELIRNR